MRVKLHSHKIIILCFVALFVFLLLSKLVSLCVKDESPSEVDEDEKGHHLEQGQLNSLRDWERKIDDKEKELSEWEQKLTRVEKDLRQRYPSDTISILKSHTIDIPTIYAITPTYARPVQKAELTRLLNTFLHVRNFHWIVVEDAEAPTSLVTNFLANSGIRYTHLVAKTPPEYKLKMKDPNWLKPRGVPPRNTALAWIRKNFNPKTEKGVVYFADDDNVYSLKLFEEMRYTKKVSVWPVGLVGYLYYERPIVVNGKVTSFFTFWEPDRPFPIDMAGFAINANLLIENPDVVFRLNSKRGYQESTLLSGFVTRNELEPRADNCTKILVWHTRTDRTDLRNEEKFKKQGLPGSDPRIEV